MIDYDLDLDLWFDLSSAITDDRHRWLAYHARPTLEKGFRSCEVLYWCVRSNHLLCGNKDEQPLWNKQVAYGWDFITLVSDFLDGPWLVTFSVEDASLVLNRAHSSISKLGRLRSIDMHWGRLYPSHYGRLGYIHIEWLERLRARGNADSFWYRVGSTHQSKEPLECIKRLILPQTNLLFRAWSLTHSNNLLWLRTARSRCI